MLLVEDKDFVVFRILWFRKNGADTVIGTCSIDLAAELEKNRGEFKEIF